MIRAETLPVEKREALLKAFATLKQTILWKWESDTLPNQPANVHIRKWMPQRELLCHPNVRVFMTHGGLLGSSEAAYCGVSVVCRINRNNTKFAQINSVSFRIFRLLLPFTVIRYMMLPVNALTIYDVKH